MNKNLRKCRRLAVWIQNIEAIYTWYTMCNAAMRLSENGDGGNFMDDAKRNAGSCLFRIMGVYPLESGEWWPSTLDDQLHVDA